MSTVSLTIRTDEQVKKDFDKFCDELGLNMTTAINLFMKTAIREQRIPFELSLNKETIKVIEEAEKGIGLSKSFSSVRELMEDLDA